jgi:hypothetical protein
MPKYPRRLDKSNREQDLPRLDDLSPDDKVFLRSMLALAETGDMVRGRYAEAHIARLLGAVFPMFGTNKKWDLRIPGRPPIDVQVKSSRGSGFKLNGFFAKDRSVWVFVGLSSDKTTRPSEFSYAVAGPADRRRLRDQLGASVSYNKLFSMTDLVVSADALPSEVRKRAKAR